MLQQMHDTGLKSEHMYMAAVASVGLSAMSWMLSRRNGMAHRDGAGDWGIFIGEWAPTFVALGNGLRTYEK